MLFADLPPYVTCQGQPAAARTVNAEGLRRRGYSPARIAAVRAMHKALYREDLTLERAQVQIAELPESRPETAPDVAMMVEFLRHASPQRGIVR